MAQMAGTTPAGAYLTYVIRRPSLLYLWLKLCAVQVRRDAAPTDTFNDAEGAEDMEEETHAEDARDAGGVHEFASQVLRWPITSPAAEFKEEYELTICLLLLKIKRRHNITGNLATSAHIHP